MSFAAQFVRIAGIIFVCSTLVSSAVMAQDNKVEISDAWARATAPAQKVGAIYMDLRSGMSARLVFASSRVAAKAELHNMTMANGVMKMSPVAGIDLPAGKVVSLAPGGYHVMLTDLKRGLVKGGTVPLTLTIEQVDKSRQTIEVNADIRELTATGVHHGTK